MTERTLFVDEQQVQLTDTSTPQEQAEALMLVVKNALAVALHNGQKLSLQQEIRWDPRDHMRFAVGDEIPEEEMRAIRARATYVTAIIRSPA
jgi:hypothetical protein